MIEWLFSGVEKIVWFIGAIIVQAVVGALAGTLGSIALVVIVAAIVIGVAIMFARRKPKALDGRPQPGPQPGHDNAA